jgi:predicted dehydrogenase
MKVLLMGSGQIGSRHLQALARSGKIASIDVVDPNAEALDMARRRFEEISDKKTATQVTYHRSLDGAGRTFDVAIIATTSAIRKEITERLLENREVRYILFEKIAFPSVQQFEVVMDLLRSMKIKAWVNCPRRSVPFFIDFKRMLGDRKISYMVQGGDWGLASSALHFIDHAAYYTEQTDYEIDASGLDQEINPSKRAGFVELTGSLRCRFKNGSEVHLHARAHSNAPTMISILGQDAYLIHQDETGSARMARKQTNWEWKDEHFRWYRQSELTHLAVEEIVRSGECSLTPLQDSYQLHKPLLQALSKHIAASTGRDCTLCPIT